jgi:hypothetical protein
MRPGIHAAMILAMTTLGAATAAAAPFSATLNLASAGFGVAGLQDPLNGLFTVTFDSAVTSTSDTEIVVLSLNRTFALPIARTYFADSDTLFIGVGNPASIVSETDDFYFRVDNLVAGGSLAIAAQTAVDVVGIYFANDLAEQISLQPLTAVPEPPTGALVGLALAGLGLAMRRRNRFGPGAATGQPA